MSRLRRREIIHILTPDDMPAEAAAEKEIMTRQGIKSVLVFRLR
jgi:hypothetical protein